MRGQPPSALGLVLFGGTADGTRAYFPLQQPGGGLTAVRLDTGPIEWKARLDTDRRGQAGAASSIPAPCSQADGTASCARSMEMAR
jgi:hypothetical protein